MYDECIIILCKQYTCKAYSRKARRPFHLSCFLIPVTSMPVTHTVNPYDTIEALIQQQERSHSQSQPPAAAAAAPMRLPSTPNSPSVKERPRIRGRMTPYAFFVQHRSVLMSI